MIKVKVWILLLLFIIVILIYAIIFDNYFDIQNQNSTYMYLDEEIVNELNSDEKAGSRAIKTL